MKRSFVSLVNIYQADQEIKHYYIANHHDFSISDDILPDILDRH